MPAAVARYRRGFSLALAAMILLMATASAPSPFYPSIADDLDLLPVSTTLIFAVYAFPLLAALLLLGSISDSIGRRPVICAGSVLLAFSMVLFWQATTLPLLLIARTLQGLAAGALIPALSATMVDFEPMRFPGVAALWNTIGPMTGLATGTIGAALLLDLLADPTAAVFGSLAVVFVAIAALAWTIPDTPRSALHWTRQVRPRFAVPCEVRPLLLAAGPAVVASWATNGLFLSLGTSFVRSAFDAPTHLGQSAAIIVLAFSGILAAIVLRRSSPRTTSLYGTTALGVGTTLSLGAVAAHSLPAYLTAVAIVGTDCGTVFMGVIRALLPHTGVQDRAAVMAVVYVISYLAFSVPTIIAGLLVPSMTLQGTMIALGLVIVVLSAVATVARLVVADPLPVRTDATPLTKALIP